MIAISLSLVQDSCGIEIVLPQSLRQSSRTHDGALGKKVETLLSAKREDDDDNVRLGDGCYHVFLDCGANVGVHGRFLFEQEKYPDANKAHTIFNEHFGTERNNSEICVFAFEPNAAHRDRHLELQEVYGKLGWRYHFEGVALSDYDGTMTFYHQADEMYNEWGFASVPFNDEAEGHNETVPTMRFKTWIENHIQNRIIPEKSIQNENDDRPPTVVMKFDMEGGEYQVLMDLFYSGVFCETIDYAFGEGHSWTNINLLQHVVMGFNGILETKELCKGKHVDWLDDESYLKDGIPLPDVPE